MRKQVVVVAKGKCPMDVLAEMGEQVRSAWIFFDKSVVDELYESSDSNIHLCDIIQIRWEATDEFSETAIQLRVRSSTSVWYEVQEIHADDIAFEYSAFDPDEIFFFTMEK